MLTLVNNKRLICRQQQNPPHWVHKSDVGENTAHVIPIRMMAPSNRENWVHKDTVEGWTSTFDVKIELDATTNDRPIQNWVFEGISERGSTKERIRVVWVKMVGCLTTKLESTSTSKLTMSILPFSLTGNDITSKAKVVRKSSSWRSGNVCRIAGLQSVAGTVTLYLKFARSIEGVPSIENTMGKTSIAHHPMDVRLATDSS